MVVEPTPEAVAHLERLRRALVEREVTEQIAKNALMHVYDVIRDIKGPYDWDVQPDGVRQADIVRMTGWTREHIRKITKSAKV